MSDMQAVCGRVKTDVEGCFSIVYEIADLFFVCDLRDQSSCYEFVLNLHWGVSFSFRDVFRVYLSDGALL